MENRIDDETLANMDQKDLEEIYLKLKKTIELRENKILSAIEAFDLAALKEALKNNKDKLLSPKAWEELSHNIHRVNYQNIEFFLFIKCILGLNFVFIF
jgi:hypothetical protein